MWKPCCLFLWQPLSESSAAAQRPWGTEWHALIRWLKTYRFALQDLLLHWLQTDFLPYESAWANNQHQLHIWWLIQSYFLVPLCVNNCLLFDGLHIFFCAINGKCHLGPWKLRLHLFAFFFLKNKFNVVALQPENECNTFRVITLCKLAAATATKFVLLVCKFARKNNERPSFIQVSLKFCGVSTHELCKWE